MSRRRRGGDVSAAEGKSRETTKTRGRDPATGSEQSIVHETGRVGATRGGRAKTRAAAWPADAAERAVALAHDILRAVEDTAESRDDHDENGHDENGHDENGHDENGHDENGHAENGRANATLSNRARSAADRLRLYSGGRRTLG